MDQYLFFLYLFLIYLSCLLQFLYMVFHFSYLLCGKCFYVPCLVLFVLIPINLEYLPSFYFPDTRGLLYSIISFRNDIRLIDVFNFLLSALVVDHFRFLYHQIPANVKRAIFGLALIQNLYNPLCIVLWNVFVLVDQRMERVYEAR